MFSSVTLPSGLSREHEGDSAETFVSSSRVGRGVHSLTLSNPAFPLPTTALPILQGSLKDGFGEAVVARDLPELGCRAA